MEVSTKKLFGIKKSLVISVFLSTGFYLTPVKSQTNTTLCNSQSISSSSDNEEIQSQSNSSDEPSCETSTSITSPKNNEAASENRLNSPEAINSTDNKLQSTTRPTPTINNPQLNNIPDRSTANQSQPIEELSAPQVNNSSSPPNIENEQISPKSSDVENESSIEKEVEEQINQYRKEEGLLPLTIDPAINKLAKMHSEEMASGEVPVGHQGFQGRSKTLADNIDSEAVSENVAYNKGYENPAKQAVEGWVKSPGHKKNIEGKYNLTGIGVAKNEQSEVFFTQIFVLSSQKKQAIQTK